jgi:nitrite reductase/ring-hydroxylating ferredoxin subunit
MAAMTVGGYLGGHLSYRRGVGVDHVFGERPPAEWTDALAESELPAATPRRVVLDGASVLLYRVGREILAIGTVCTHAGGPLDEGDIDAVACTVRCPWHGSVFRLADGSVVHGPAVAPEPAYETRVRDGRIEVRRV